MEARTEFATEECINSIDIDERITDLEESDLMTHEEHEEVQHLKRFKSEAIELLGETEWHYGLYFIRDDYFVEHARELAEDMGFPKMNMWPYMHIDWRAAADELKYDYNRMEPLLGATYWVRG